MAFRTDDISVIAYANGFTLWHYTSEDVMEEVLKPNYFKKFHNTIKRGDIIIINAKDETSIKVFEKHGDITLTNLK